MLQVSPMRQCQHEHPYEHSRFTETPELNSAAEGLPTEGQGPGPGPCASTGGGQHCCPDQLTPALCPGNGLCVPSASQPLKSQLLCYRKQHQRKYLPLIKAGNPQSTQTPATTRQSTEQHRTQAEGLRALPAASRTKFHVKCFPSFAAGLALKPGWFAVPRNQLPLKSRAAPPAHTAALGAPGDQHGRCTHGRPEKKRRSRDFHAIPRGTHNGEGRRKRKKKKTSNRCSQPQNKWHFLTPLIPLMANKLEPQIIIPALPQRLSSAKLRAPQALIHHGW